jgi:hypothetical protein
LEYFFCKNWAENLALFDKKKAIASTLLPREKLADLLALYSEPSAPALNDMRSNLEPFAFGESPQGLVLSRKSTGPALQKSLNDFPVPSRDVTD